MDSPGRIFETVLGKRFGFDPGTDVFGFCGVFWYRNNSVTNREGTKRCHVFYGFEIWVIFTTRKLKNRDGNLETEIFSSLFRYGKTFPSLNRDGKQFPSLFRDGKLFPSLFRDGKISVSKFPSLKMARYVPSKF